MKESRNEEVIAAKMPAALAKQIKQAASKEDRTVSAWLRRHFAAVFSEPSQPRGNSAR